MLAPQGLQWHPLHPHPHLRSLHPRHPRHFVVSLFSSMLPIYNSALFANPRGNGASEAWIPGEFDQSSDVQIIGSHKFQVTYAQLHGQRQIQDNKHSFSLEKHSFFITDIHGKPSNLHVEPLDLFSCTLHLEVLVYNLS